MAIAIGLLKTILELVETRKTGVLDVLGPGAGTRVRVFMEDGCVVFADEGGGRATVDGPLSASVEQRVMRALGWPSARFTFVASAGPLDLTARFGTPIEPLVIASLRLADRERIDELLRQARERFVALRGDHVPGGGSARLETIARLNAFRLSPSEDAFARGLDGTHTMAEVLAQAGGEVDRATILAALLLTDSLDLHAGASPSRSRAVRAAPPQPAVPRPAALAAPAKPATPAEPPSSAAEVPASSEPPSTPRSLGGAPMAPLLAEKAYQAGRRLARAYRLGEAAAELRRAASLYPATEYDLWAAWAEARADAGGEDAHSPALRAVAELAIAQDTERGFATFVLGHLARRAGDDAAARELFARAKEIDPEIATEVETLDAWEVRLRIEAAAPAESTKGEVRALAPLMTTANADADADANADADENANADADADANADGNADADADADANENSNENENENALLTPAPALAPAPAEPVPSPAPPRGVLNVVVVVVVAVVGAAIAYALVPATGERRAPAPLVSTPVASIPPAASTPDLLPAAPSTTPSTSDGEASYAAVDAGLPPPPALPSVDGSRGILLTPPEADGHRLYVDGRMAGVPPPAIVVPCGRHTVKIGSQGREQTVLVPCGGSLEIAYP